MKWIFLIALAVVSLLMVIAKITMPQAAANGIPTLVWATDDNPARQEQMQLFREWYQKTYGEKIDIRIDPANQDRSKVVVQSLSGAAPDLFDYFATASLERYIKSGIILDVTEEAKKLGFSKEIVWEGVWPSFVSEGRQYAFPDNVANYAFIYHRDLFDKAGIPYPTGDWTWEQFLETAKKLSFQNPDGHKQYALLEIPPQTMIYQNGARMFSPEGTTCTFNTPQAIEALQFYKDLREKYGVMPTASELASQASAGGWGDNLNVFATKHFAMTRANRSWYIGFERDARQQMAKGNPPPYNLGVAPYPYFKEKWGPGGARCTGISRTSKNIKYAVRFLQYLASEPFNRQINRTFDALAPVKKYCTGPTGIADGPAPLPGLDAANDSLWFTSMSYTHEAEVSPFISPYLVGKYWGETQELFESANISPKEMLDRYTNLVNEAIQRNITKDPTLRSKYEAAKQKEQQLLATTKSHIPPSRPNL